MAYGTCLTAGREIFTVLATVCAHIKNNYIQRVTETKNNEACVFSASTAGRF